VNLYISAAIMSRNINILCLFRPNGVQSGQRKRVKGSSTSGRNDCARFVLNDRVSRRILGLGRKVSDITFYYIRQLAQTLEKFPRIVCL